MNKNKDRENRVKENKTSTSVNKSLIFIIFATLLGKVLGLLRDILLANFYGTGILATAFVAASKLPLNFFDIALGAVIGSSFIPTFNKTYKEKGKDYSISFANEFISIILIISVIFSIIGVLFSPQLVSFITDLKGQTYDIAVSLSKIMFPLLIFTALAFTFVGILQSFGEFNVPAAISIISNLAIIIYFIFFDKYFGIYGLAISMVIGWFLQMFLQVPFLKKYQFKIRISFTFKHKELLAVASLMLPILISTWVQPINILINTYLASSIDGGTALVILDYANKVFIIVSGVFVLAVTNISFPSFARFIAKKDFESFKKLLNSALNLVFYFMFPLTVGLVIHANNIIELLFQHGKFTANETALVGSALILYSLGIVFYGVREIMNRAYYSYGDSKVPMYIAICGIAINVGLALLFIKKYSLFGLPLASSLSTLFMALSLLGHFHFKKQQIFSVKSFTYLLKIVIMSMLMGLAVYYTEAYLVSINKSLLELVKLDKLVILIRLIIAGIVGILTYMLPLKLMGLNIPKMEIEQ